MKELFIIGQYLIPIILGVVSNLLTKPITNLLGGRSDKRRLKRIKLIENKIAEIEKLHDNQSRLIAYGFLVIIRSVVTLIILATALNEYSSISISSSQFASVIQKVLFFLYLIYAYGLSAEYMKIRNVFYFDEFRTKMHETISKLNNFLTK